MVLIGLASAVAPSVGQHTRLPLALSWRTDNLSGEGFEAGGIKAELYLNPLALDRFSIDLQIDDVTTDTGAHLNDIRFECAEFIVESPGFQCEEGHLSFSHPSLSPARMPLAIHWRGESGGEIRLFEAPILGSEVLVTVTPSAASGWRLQVQSQQIDLTALSERYLPPDMTLSGAADLDAEVNLPVESAAEIHAVFDLSSIEFEDSSAEWLGAGLEGSLDIQLSAGEKEWTGVIASHWHGGEVLTPFAYAEILERHPLILESGFVTDPSFNTLKLTDLKFHQQPWIRANADATLSLKQNAPLTRATLNFSPVDLPTVYERYMLPVIVHPVLSELDLSGRLGGALRFSNGDLSGYDLRLKNISVQADAGTTNFELVGIDGRLANGVKSRLSWQSGKLLGFSLGPTKIPLKMSRTRARIRESVSIPVLDGALNLDAFSVDWRETPPDIALDAILLPVSMSRITEALVWPPMQGTLSGVLPRVSLEKGTLKVGGNLLVQAFDGDIVIRNLKVTDIFGFWPILTADAQCRDLDLETLTGTYEFGRITGQLEGRVDGLRMENWKPVAFDARFQTPEKDRTKHRISQQAVDNITSLSGNNLSGVLSRTFLRFFKEFSYSRLGIACRLRNGICDMDGVAPAENGYYLVKGGGIPRIDVIGFNRSTDWDILVERLLSITEGGPPVIE